MKSNFTDKEWWQSSDPDLIYNKSERTSYYIEMKDGVKLAADLYLPAGITPGTKLPAILHLTRLYRRSKIRWPFKYFINNVEIFTKINAIDQFVKNGYAFINVDLRGSGASFGYRTIYKDPNVINDGIEILDWIVNQPWSNGITGLFGKSLDGAVSEMILNSGHSSLKAAIIQHAPYDLFSDLVCPGGIKNESFLIKAGYYLKYRDINVLPRSMRGLSRLIFRMYNAGIAPVMKGKKGKSLLKRALLEHKHNYNMYDYYQNIKFRDDKGIDGTIYDNLSGFKIKKNQSKIPVYCWGGWYDGAIIKSDINRFLNTNAPGCKLLIGPWEHSGKQIPHPYAEENRISKFDAAGEKLRFFNYHLKGIAENGFGSEPAVCYFNIGNNTWRTSNTWPVNEVKQKIYYLRINNMLIEESPSKISGSDKFTFSYDTTTGTSSRWSSQSNILNEPIIFNYNHDIDPLYLTYVSSPLEYDTEITGHALIRLFIKTDTPDLNLFFYLQDLDLEGNIYYITEGIFKIINNTISTSPYIQPVPYHSCLKDDAVYPRKETIQELNIDMLPISYTVMKGHSIRLSISAADKDNFIVSYDHYPETEVFHGEDNPSAIILPCIVRQ